MKPYIDLLKDVLENGKDHNDRTGTGTKRVFGRQIRFDLKDGFPLCTTKEVNIQAVYSELLWFISGSSNRNALRAIRWGNEHYNNNSKPTIWDGNYNDQAKKLGYKDGYLGPVYGYQWRFANGVDQLSLVEKQIRENPDSRRIILDSWNPADIDKMSLPPCHVLQQWWVEDNVLSLQVYQRSWDLFLGAPFNIASYALMMHMMAKVTGREVGELIFSAGDCHIYLDHLDQVREQISRKPYPLESEIHFHGNQKTLDDFEMNDLIFHSYQHHPKLTGKMSS